MPAIPSHFASPFIPKLENSFSERVLRHHTKSLFSPARARHAPRCACGTAASGRDNPESCATQRLFPSRRVRHRELSVAESFSISISRVIRALRFPTQPRGVPRVRPKLNRTRILHRTRNVPPKRRRRGRARGAVMRGPRRVFEVRIACVFGHSVHLMLRRNECWRLPKRTQMGTVTQILVGITYGN